MCDYFKVFLKTTKGAFNFPGNVEVILSVRGVGASLDGATGWIDFGTRYNSCYVDVNFCQKGMSVALWVKAIELGVHNASVILLFGRGDSGLKMAYTKYGRIELSITSGLLGKEWQLTTLNNTVKPNIWYHVLFTWSIDNGTSMFINGRRCCNVLKCVYVNNYISLHKFTTFFIFLNSFYISYAFYYKAYLIMIG